MKSFYLLVSIKNTMDYFLYKDILEKQMIDTEKRKCPVSGHFNRTMIQNMRPKMSKHFWPKRKYPDWNDQIRALI